MRAHAAWFRQDRTRSPEEIAGVLAVRLWGLAERFVDNLSRAGCEIGTPERGLRLMAEALAFGLQACDRAAHGSLAQPRRAALIQALGARLAALLEDNGLAGRAQHIALFNRRGADYAQFEDIGGFAALRYLAHAAREALVGRDQDFAIEQVMDVEAPELLDTLRRIVAGMLGPKF